MSLFNWTRSRSTPVARDGGSAPSIGQRHDMARPHGVAESKAVTPGEMAKPRGATRPNEPLALPAPPTALEQHLVYPPTATAEQQVDIHIDARHTGNPLFRSWIHDLALMGVQVKIKKASAAELVELRQQQRGTTRTRDEMNLDTLQLARQLLSDCAMAGGSDLHVLVREKHTEIQLRVKGDLKTAERYWMRREEGETLVRAIYTGLANVKDSTYKPREFQDAQISGEELLGTGLSSVRIIRGPAYPVDLGAGFLVARLQYGRSRARDAQAAAAAARRLGLRVPARPPGEFRLGQMGYTALQVEMVERLVRRPMGIVVVVGPTGSGKTTTLFECMNHQARLFPSQRIDTIENPPEYPMEWAVQLATESERFPEMLRMTLRMDPDTILLGEVRGVDEAIAALQAAMTGHMVFTTLHVTDPFETFSRLEMLDHVRLARPIICNHRQIVGLIAQRIVPLLCSHCSVPLTSAEDRLPPYMLRALRTWGDLSGVRVRGEGCSNCGGEAIEGQQAVAEVVVTDEALMRDCIELGVLAASRNHRKKPGSDKPMIAHAMDLVFGGRLDPVDAESSVDEIPSKEAIQ